MNLIGMPLVKYCVYCPAARHMQIDNVPQWDTQKNEFYEIWYLKLNQPSAGPLAGPALWLRLTTLSLGNGLKKVAETWAIFFEPQAQSASRKIAIRNTSSIGAYSTREDGTVQIEDSVLGPGFTSGAVVGRGHRIEWDLKFDPNPLTFFHVPQTLKKMRIARSNACKPNVNIRLQGSFTVNGTRYECADAPGCQGHLWGKRLPREWAWAHCNLFDGAGGENAVIEALSSRLQIGGVLNTPPISAMYFEYKGERHEFNRLTDAVSIRTNYALTKWQFAADRGPLRLLGEVSCDLKDLVAVTYEDTQGSFVYCNNTELASMNLSVYFKGKLDATLRSRMTTGFETASRQRSPYVEVLI